MRRASSATGPGIGFRLDRILEETGIVYPGRLHIYDVESERSYLIVTNQGDSEVLLVENNTVYYRVSDRVYSVALTDQGLGPARLLATSDLVRDAHWAFIKR
jgi:hypothetical protein